MTGRNKPQKPKRKVSPQQVDSHQQAKQQQKQPIDQHLVPGTSAPSQPQLPIAQPDDSVASTASNVSVSTQRVVREQPAARKVFKAEIDESRTLKHVFKSNPDSQMRDFIKKAAKPSQQTASKALPKTPAEAHPPAVVQELLDTDDDVADNLGKLFKASKSYKNS